MKSKLNSLSVIVFVLVFVLSGCAPQTDTSGKLEISYEQYMLENGLDVILHEDRSDPIVAVALQFHVGSNREEPGRTGFAHLFEHMMFQESQHVGQDQFFKKIQGAGGMLNGGTGNDGTVYFEVLPKNALEMALWLESDRLGFLRSTITQEAFANQQGVVKNEKRQAVDNRPYGHTEYIIGKLLYPESHPYNWQVIGSMEDLTNATLKDVHEFHRKWYTPRNCTLVVAGDFDKAQAKQWIEKYFGEIESGDPVEDPPSIPVTLEQSKMAYYEDNFARSPELTMVIPTVEQYHPDAYALDFLGQLMSYGKKAPLYKVIVEEKKLAPSVSGYNMSQEIAGEFRIRIRTFPEVDLDDVKAAILETYAKFETESFTEQDVERIKAGIETGFYNGLASILYKSFQLGQYNEYAGSPGYVTTDLKKIKGVTREDILRVYDKYIKDKPFVLTGFVPRGQAELAVESSVLFPIQEEAILVEEQAAAPIDEFKVEPTESSFDRTVEPSQGADPEIAIPTIWQDSLANGIKILGIEQTELPLVSFSLSLKGGQLLDGMDKVGVARLVGRLMMEGTKSKTPVELEEAIDELGAGIFVRAGRESFSISANCLNSKFKEVYALMEEILLEPRWDEKEFARIKEETLEVINRNMANPNAISSEVFNKLIYGDDHIYSLPLNGTKATIEAISIQDLKDYYAANISPSVTHVSIAGDITQEEAVQTFSGLEEKWSPKEVALPRYPLPEPPSESKVYFVNVPGAKQSVIRIGNLGMSYSDPDYYPATVMNYRLGGSFNGLVNLVLREEKGYTYGARSGFSGSLIPGTFAASSSVQSRVTLESVQIFKDLMTKYREGISEEELEFTKNALIKSNAMRFETLGALLGMLNTTATYDLPFDYIKKEEEITSGMTLDRHMELAQKYIQPDRMIYLIVGDAATQMKSLKEIGFGDPILIDLK